MPIALGSKAKKEVPTAETPAKADTAKTPEKTSSAPASFLKTGKAAHAALAHAEEQAEQAQSGLFRFFIPKKKIGESFKIVFLDGQLDAEGMLDNPMFYEHTVFHNGKWANFIKPNQEEGPDPIMADTGKDASLVQVFTILNLTPYEKRDGTVVPFHKQLYVCKRNTMKRLAAYAKKKDGLAGCVFEVTRTNEKGENVGDMFDFESKETMADLVKQFGAEHAAPANYAEVLKYRSRDELIKLGFGAGQQSIKGGDVGDDESYGDQL